MFEFAGRFYKTGVSAASVSSTVTIGGKDNGGNTSSIEKKYARNKFKSFRC